MRKINLREHPMLALVIGIIFGSLVELADYLTGLHVVLAPFHLLIVLYFTWFWGRRSGIVVAIIAGVASVITDYLTGEASVDQGISIWNTVARVTLFIAGALLLNRLQIELCRQRDANEKLRRANDEIWKLSKVKDDFTAMVSHELRTPLVAIRESMSIIVDGLAGPVSDEQKEYLALGMKNIERLKRLINDVLDFFKMSSGKREYRMIENDIGDLIKEIAAFYSPVAGNKGLTITCDIPIQELKCPFDLDSISQVLNNLVGNAVKFTRQGSIAIGAHSQEDHLVVYVKDAGPGISNQNINRLFKPFEQISRHSEGGTGLGLAICKQIIDQHQGKIWAESDFGKGATFFFSLPLEPRRITCA